MTSQDDEVLARLVTGDLRADSAAVRELFARRPEMAARAEQLRELATRLGTEGAAERDVIAAAKAAALPEDLDAVRVASAAMPKARVRPVRSPYVPFALLAVAAVLIAVGAMLLMQSDPSPSAPEFLDDQRSRAEVIELQVPAQPLAIGGQLSWTGSANEGRLERAQRWLLEFHSVAQVDRSATLLLAFKTQENEWTLTAADRAQLDDTVLLTVHRIDSDNRRISSSTPRSLSLAR